MERFTKFKEMLKSQLRSRREKAPQSLDLTEVLEQADNWDALESRLVELRARSRRRQQEVLERLEPLARRAEEILSKAKAANIKIVRQHLLRQAEGYLHELEMLDEPAKIHSANCKLLTNIIRQVQRAAAMEEPMVTASAVDALTSRLEEIVTDYEDAREAAEELDSAGVVREEEMPDAEAVEARLAGIMTVQSTAGELADPEEMEFSAIEQGLYGEPA